MVTKVDPIKTLISDMYSELAGIEDEQKRQEQGERVQDLLRRYDGDDAIITSDEMRNIVAQQRSTDELKIMSSLPTLDGALEGFRLGTLNVISAPTGAGKTTFAKQLTKNFHAAGVNSLWFSYEVPMHEFLETMPPEVVFSTPRQLKGDKVEWLARKVVEAKVKYNAQVVFIDHLHYLINFSRSTNVSLLIGELCRNLKKLAVKWNVAIFLVAHLKKTRFEADLEMDDIRDSSFIAQESDTVILMKRDTVNESGMLRYTNTVTATLQKNRRTGKTCTWRMEYDHETHTLYE